MASFTFTGELGVDSQQVPVGEVEATDRCLSFNAVAGTMSVVSVRPGGQLGGALISGVVATGISPFSKCGLDEAFSHGIVLGEWGFVRMCLRPRSRQASRKA